MQVLLRSNNSIARRWSRQPFHKQRWHSSTDSSKQPKDKRNAFQATLNMPQTKYKPRFGGAVREPHFHARCTSDLYKWQERVRAEQTTEECFVLHDGPPYANGELHLGHLMNKSLKDFINRYQLLNGKRIDYVPGWDCHGLPIELKALEKLKKGKKSKRIDVANALEVRKAARSFAAQAVKGQMADFRRWGILANWAAAEKSVKERETGNNPVQSQGHYTTMDVSYELAQLQVFSDMVDADLVYRGLKPVYWSPSTKTALAEAELEYPDDHYSPAAYITLPIKTKQGLENKVPFSSIDLLVWTTTPWTMVANAAVCVNKEAEYSIIGFSDYAEELAIRNNSNPKLVSKLWIVASNLVEQLDKEVFPSVVGTSFEADKPLLHVYSTLQGSELVGLEYEHPIPSPASIGVSCVVLDGDHVVTDSGTGLVHTAPAHGQDDFNVWVSSGRSAESSPRVVDENGCYDFGAYESRGDQSLLDDKFWTTLQGEHVMDAGNQKVLDYLKHSDYLLHTYSFQHRYPYDWRSKKPVILRLTDQWFVDVGSLGGAIKQALADVEVVPQVSKSRLLAMLQGRVEWCISRQRAWGVPIPAFYDHQGNPILTRESVAHVSQVLKSHPLGMDAWWHLDVAELLPPELLEQHTMNPFTKEVDTLDVWFDSGCSWNGVLKARGFNRPANIYLEGSDQHRGWFQSSLLTKLGANSQPESPYSTVITHGFLVDEKGRKMSKSIGNVLVPSDFINGKEHKFGVDVLRLWVASCDYTGDAPVGPNVLKKVGTDLAKIRHTTRYMLSSMGDFNAKTQLSNMSDLEAIDRYVLNQLALCMTAVEKGYLEYNFRTVYSQVMRFISQDLSSIYITSTKDRLRANNANSASRRSCQTTLWHVLQCLTLAIAPITCHMAEDTFEHARKIGDFHRFECDQEAENTNDEVFSVFQNKWPSNFDTWTMSVDEHDKWQQILRLRYLAHQAIEKLSLGTQMESSQIEIKIADNPEGRELHSYLATLLEVQHGCAFTTQLASLFLVAECQIQLVDMPDDVSVNRFQSLYSEGGGPMVYVEARDGTASENGGLQKCDRCWMFASLEPAVEGASLCARCTSVL